MFVRKLCSACILYQTEWLFACAEYKHTYSTNNSTILNTGVTILNYLLLKMTSIVLLPHLSTVLKYLLTNDRHPINWKRTIIFRAVNVIYFVSVRHWPDISYIWCFLSNCHPDVIWDPLGSICPSLDATCCTLHRYSFCFICLIFMVDYERAYTTFSIMSSSAIESSYFVRVFPLCIWTLVLSDK